MKFFLKGAASMFSDNLDLIMKLTNTQASALGAACHLVPSHVSRLRTGTRPLPKNPGFLRSMSEYLAKRITTEQQKKVMCGILGVGSMPDDVKISAELIEKWLTDDERSSEILPDISPLIKSFAAPSAGFADDQDYIPDNSEIKSFYYGSDGKREAVLRFFDLILKEKKPQTLLLFSDEKMDWLYDDRAFSVKWLHCFTRVLRAGNRVKIIHDTGRKFNEMLEAVAKWIPVYRTGMIEPYFCPKLRDGIYHRTLFIAPETAAIVSSSVGSGSDGMLNELITDKEALGALAAEFDNYLAFCRPLMHIITPQAKSELWKAYDALMSADGDIICMSDTPTLATMPEHVAEAMQIRAPKSCILERRNAAAKLAETLAGNYTEIVPTDLLSAAPPALPCGELLGAKGLCYTEDEWRSHIKNSVISPYRSDNIPTVNRSVLPSDVTIIAKEDRGVIVIKNTFPCVAFAFSERNLVNSFFGYLTAFPL